MNNSVNGSPPSLEELTKHFEHACHLHESGNPGEAVELYEYLLTFITDSSFLHFNCGLAYFDLEQFEEAEKRYQRACELAPDDPDIHYNQGLNFKRLGKTREAVESFTRAFSLGDHTVDTLYNLALCHQDLQDISEASRLYDMVLLKDPAHQSTLNNYAYLCHKSGQSNKAEAFYRRLLKQNPDHQAAQHMVNSLSGETPDSAPLEYVEAVFDNYAKEFEQSLVEKLQYKTPQALWDRYCLLFPKTTRERCLDLGCGTGLAGIQFMPCCTNMVGVDISEEMLAVANEKKLYQELIKDDILHFLETTHHSYDLIVAADVFTYLGDLSGIFTACFEKSNDKGIFLFSVEETSADQFELKKTGRFGHSVGYIQNLCHKSGWSLLDNHYSRLRKEKEEWIKGSLFILQK